MGMTAADFEQIRNLLARYSHTLDLGDSDGFVRCFTSEGEFDTSSPEDDLFGTHRGHGELRKFAVASAEYSVARVRTTCANLLIEGDGSTAKVSSYAFVTRDYGPPIIEGQVTYARLVTTGMFFDELVKVGGDWKFARRVFRHDGLPDVLERVSKPISVGPGTA
ncbi:nuclear transport factor 2 family protein [Sinomonas sp. G460-2]|uniref:nuclear transport factor 2 family protein n=1 Tax=Sinomonas sp. G460-2 TaxID=3393464 RepID=UPI0039EF2BAA